jgi:hypothetical protein
MRKLALTSLLLLSTGSILAQDARPGGPWQTPSCKSIAGTNSVAITSDQGATLLTPGRPLRPTSYAYGLAVLQDVPNTMLLAYGRTLQRSTSAGCRWTTVGTIQSTSDGFPISLVAARGDRAFIWSDNRNDLARVDGTSVTYLATPVASVVGVGTDPVDANRVRLGDGDGRLWESTDGGVSFGQVGTQIPGSSFLYYRAAFDPGDLDHVVVGAAVNGAFVTFDGGRNWTRATGLSSTGTGPVNIFSIVVSPADPRTVYAMGLDIAESDAGVTSQGRHIFMSRDGGLTFTPIVDRSNDVILPNGVPMAAHPTNPSVVYFTYGTSFGGYGADLYRYDDATRQVTKTHNAYHGLPSMAFNPADPAFMYLGLALESVN